MLTLIARFPWDDFNLNRLFSRTLNHTNNIQSIYSCAQSISMRCSAEMPASTARTKNYVRFHQYLCWPCALRFRYREQNVFLVSIMFPFIFLLNFNMHQMPLFLHSVAFFRRFAFAVAVVSCSFSSSSVAVCSALLQLRRAHGKPSSKRKRQRRADAHTHRQQGRGGQRQESVHKNGPAEKLVCIFML